MAFPAIDAVAGYESGNAASHSMSYPTISSGDLAILMGSVDGSGDTISGFGSTGFGSNVLANVNAQSHGHFVAWHESDGTETTVSITPTSTEQLSGFIVAISGWHGTDGPEISSIANGSSTGPNSPSLTPSWGSDDTLWISFVSHNSSPGITSYPYADNNNIIGTAYAAQATFCSDEIASATVDPGAYVFGSGQWQASTIAVKPAAAAGGAAAQAHHQHMMVLH